MNRMQVLLALALVGIFGTAMLAFAWDRGTPAVAISAATARPDDQDMPPLDGATAWINSGPLTPAALRGKVVLVNFWTYSCINSLRQLPHVRAWAEKYKDKGLVVIGAHAPEFAFEHDVDNVRRAVHDLGIDYPVAVDSEHGIWNSFRNQYWPALYFVDAQGRVRYRKFGEGDYPQLEATIQQLLIDAGAQGVGHAPASVVARGAEADADWADLRSPETYLGYARSERFASPGGVAQDQHRTYAVGGELRLNHWALSGDWRIGTQAAVLDASGGRIVYRFHARDLHLVMGPPAKGASVRYRVRIDGKPPGAAHGVDVDGQGDGTVTQPRMYQLVRQQKPIVEREFEIEFLDPGVQAFAFTFG